MRLRLAGYVYRIWRWLTPLWPVSQRNPTFTREFADATREDRRRLYLSLRQQPGFRLLLEELDHHKAGFEQELLALPGSVRDDTVADAIKARMIRCGEATFWIGWLQWKVAQAAPVPAQPKVKESSF